AEREGGEPAPDGDARVPSDSCSVVLSSAVVAVEAAAEGDGEEAAAEEDGEEAATEEDGEEAAAEEEVAPNVYFQQPTNNAIVPPTFTVKMAAGGLAVDPAGDIVEGSGHMHILVNEDFIAPGEVIVNDETHLHYGDASLVTEVTLEPGTYTLRLQFANGAHIALEGDEYRDEITVEVAEDAADQSVRFVTPQEGDTVTSPFDVEMAATGLMVEPAGDIVDGSGHMHILVNEDFVEAGEVIVNDETHLHYGKAQLVTTVELEPGEYTLRLQMANGAHIALEGDQYRDEITITVGE
ncbi:MAG: DUF4399 domain-containing protein, partial [Chloroflexota bacterium]